MSKTSNVSDLMARLQEKIEQDRKQIEALTQSELKKLAENLRQSVQDASYIIVRDIKNHTRWMNAVLWGAWLRSVAEDLKQQVKRLAADYKEIAEVLRGV